ncbi:MAG: hypothetical protein OHK0029_25700 [Armatimonadaceae bacterium]
MTQRVVGHCVAAMKHSGYAAALLDRPTLKEGDLERARLSSRTAFEASRHAIIVMGRSGIVPVEMPKSRSIALDQLDTEDTRELLDLLMRARDVAERVDRARGRCVGDHVPLEPGEPSGTDLAEDLWGLSARLHGEVFGPAGRE